MKDATHFIQAIRSCNYYYNSQMQDIKDMEGLLFASYFLNQETIAIFKIKFK